LRFVYCARHPALNRVCDQLERSFRRRQTDRQVRDAEVRVKAANNYRLSPSHYKRLASVANVHLRVIVSLRFSENLMRHCSVALNNFSIKLVW